MATSIRSPETPRTYEPTDSSWADLDDGEVSESLEQDRIIEETRWSLKALARLRRWDVYIGHHTFFAWKQGDPRARLAPDLYLVDGQPADPELSSWQKWMPGFLPPVWALEVVSENWRKDYCDSLPKYTQLGCSELVIFDPLLLRDRPADGKHLRKPLTVFRLGTDGKLQRFYSGQGPAYSRELRVWLAAGLEGYQPMIRLWLDKAGKKVVPTEDEARKEQARKTDEAERRDYQNRAERERVARQRDAAEFRADQERADRERMARERDAAKFRADQERADRERVGRERDAAELRADQERADRERMAERMRRAGLDPDDES